MALTILCQATVFLLPFHGVTNIADFLGGMREKHDRAFSPVTLADTRFDNGDINTELSTCAALGEKKNGFGAGEFQAHQKKTGECQEICDKGC